MHIVLVGAGEVGAYLAERLSREGHAVVVVESDRERADRLSEHLDVQVVVGSGTTPSVLTEAGIDKAELLAAVTNHDEVNLVACFLAKQHGVTTTVARMENRELQASAGRQLRETMAVDLVIDPDAETADEILHLITYRGVDEIHELGGGGVSIVGITLSESSPVVRRTLAEIAAEHEPHWDWLVGAITRRNETIIPRGNHRLEPGDHLRVVLRNKRRREVFRLLGVQTARARRVMVLGAGRIGGIVAGHLEQQGTHVVVVERNRRRAETLAERLRHAVVVQGEITDAELLLEEAVGTMDAVVASTGEDDANVLACAFAEAEGAKWTVTVLHGLALRPLVQELGIDAAVTPRTASANAILRYVRGGLAGVTTFLESEAEVDEIELRPGSEAEGAVIAELRLPKEVLVGAVVRDGDAQIARGRTQLRARDHVILLGKPATLTEARRVFE